jgi:Mitochondrial inner-membrane-bound regulator
MILRANSSSNICLRCQTHLSRILIPPESFLWPCTQLPRGVRLQHNEARPETPEPNLRAHDVRQEHHDERRFDRSLASNDSPHKSIKQLNVGGEKLTRYPFGRLYGVRGHQKREKAVGLDINSLGTPSEVIVLRDAAVRQIPSKMEDVETPERVDILAQLDAERGLISQAEVEKNIEELMPKGDAKGVSWAELRGIQEQLVSGFTVTQLVKYIDSFKARSDTAKSRDEDQHKAGPLGPIRRKTAWMAGISETGGYFEENSLRGYGSEAFTPKQRLVLQLLRQCWGIEVQEVTESIGEIELELEQTELELLISRCTPV